MAGITMNLIDILTPECVRAPLVATGKQGVIDELVDVLAAAGKVRDADALKQAVWTRELTRTTGIGRGLAIPHGKCDGIDELVIAVGKPSTPMDFESIDSQPVELIVLLASPPDRTSDHIQALAQISRLISIEEFRAEVYAASNAEQIFELFKQQQRS